MTVCGIKHADGVCVMGECPHFKKCCPVVWDKSGKPMTNEEWFCQLDTEDKAKWLSRNSKFMYGCGRMETTPKVMYEEDWECWLKQPHTSKE